MYQVTHSSHFTHYSTMKIINPMSSVSQGNHILTALRAITKSMNRLAVYSYLTRYIHGIGKVSTEPLPEKIICYSVQLILSSWTDWTTGQLNRLHLYVNLIV